MWHCSVDVAYLWLSDWTRLQWALRSLIFGVRHSDFLVVGTKIEIHNNGFLGKDKMYSFYLDVGRIIGNFHFQLFLWELLGVISLAREGANFFWRKGGIGQLAQDNI